jgi:2-polyprenyl-3-methyl-5-hydroxy-6-metoxy-1,4-benzoquinol methylase
MGLRFRLPGHRERLQSTGPQTSAPQMSKVDIASPEVKRLLDRHWYYTVELTPGFFTRGGEHPNVVCTRELLRRLNPTGLDICDIGTAEGMIPILLKRRGARSVVALDAGDSREKVQLVQQCYGEGFEYFPRVSLSRVKDFLTERARLSGFPDKGTGERGFEVVVLSGLLYHVFSPLHVVGLARTLLRQGGLLILETAASSQDRFAQFWNFRGDSWIYRNGTNTWFMTLKLLDHLLRFMKFRPMDCLYGKDFGDIVRVAVAAVAVADPIPLETESEWFLTTTRNFDYDEMVDTEWARGDPVTISYSPGNNTFHPGPSGTVNLHKTVAKSRALALERDRIIFHLADQD